MLVRISCLMFLLLLCVSGSFAAAKPEPPEGFVEMIKTLQSYEKSVEEGQWSEAIEKKVQFDKTFVTVQENFNQKVPGTSQRFATISAQLQKALKDRNSRAANTAYVNFEHLLLELADYYEFRVHPAQILITGYLEDAMAAAKAGDGNEVNNELEEISGLYGLVRKHLESRGEAPLAAKIQEQIESAEKAATRKDMPTVIKYLQQAEVMFAVSRSPSGK